MLGFIAFVLSQVEPLVRASWPACRVCRRPMHSSARVGRSQRAHAHHFYCATCSGQAGA